jgi:hypothetical protein
MTPGNRFGVFPAWYCLAPALPARGSAGAGVSDASPGACKALNGAPDALNTVSNALNGASDALKTVFDASNGASDALNTVFDASNGVFNASKTVFNGLNGACYALGSTGAAVAAAPTGFFQRFLFFLTFFHHPPIPMRKLITNFDNTAKMEIGPLAQNCLNSLAGNPRYPAAQPERDAVQSVLTPYLAAAAVLHATPTQTAELAKLRASLNQALSGVAIMANGLYPDDEAALLSTGLALSKERERHTTLEAPAKFQLVDGPQPGTLCAKAKRPPHAVALKYLYTLDATLPDNQWYTVVVRDGDGLLTACKTADRVYCKVAAVGGDTEQQPFTDVLSRLVQ